MQDFDLNDLQERLNSVKRSTPPPQAPPSVEAEVVDEWAEAEEAIAVDFKAAAPSLVSLVAILYVFRDMEAVPAIGLIPTGFFSPIGQSILFLALGGAIATSKRSSLRILLITITLALAAAIPLSLALHELKNVPPTALPQSTTEESR